MESKYDNIIERLSKLETNMRSLLKITRKMAKVQDPNQEKSVNPKPNGFNKPVSISPQLASFLDIAPDTQISRSEVTKGVNKYIKDHELQNPENRKQIICDKNLTKLLSPPQGFTLTYLNLQTLLKKHYIKKE